MSVKIECSLHSRALYEKKKKNCFHGQINLTKRWNPKNLSNDKGVVLKDNKGIVLVFALFRLLRVPCCSYLSVWIFNFPTLFQVPCIQTLWFNFTTYPSRRWSSVTLSAVSGDKVFKVTITSTMFWLSALKSFEIVLKFCLNALMSFDDFNLTKASSNLS